MPETPYATRINGSMPGLRWLAALWGRVDFILKCNVGITDVCDVVVGTGTQQEALDVTTVCSFLQEAVDILLHSNPGPFRGDLEFTASFSTGALRRVPVADEAATKLAVAECLLSVLIGYAPYTTGAWRLRQDHQGYKGFLQAVEDAWGGDTALLTVTHSIRILLDCTRYPKHLTPEQKDAYLERNQPLAVTYLWRGMRRALRTGAPTVLARLTLAHATAILHVRSHFPEHPPELETECALVLIQRDLLHQCNGATVDPEVRALLLLTATAYVHIVCGPVPWGIRSHDSMNYYMVVDPVLGAAVARDTPLHLVPCLVGAANDLLAVIAPYSGTRYARLLGRLRDPTEDLLAVAEDLYTKLVEALIRMVAVFGDPAIVHLPHHAAVFSEATRSFTELQRNYTVGQLVCKQDVLHAFARAYSGAMYTPSHRLHYSKRAIVSPEGVHSLCAVGCCPGALVFRRGEDEIEDDADTPRTATHRQAYLDTARILFHPRARLESWLRGEEYMGSNDGPLPDCTFTSGFCKHLPGKCNAADIAVLYPSMLRVFFDAMDAAHTLAASCKGVSILSLLGYKDMITLALTLAILIPSEHLPWQFESSVTESLAACVVLHLTTAFYLPRDFPCLVRATAERLPEGTPRDDFYGMTPLLFLEDTLTTMQPSEDYCDANASQARCAGMTLRVIRTTRTERWSPNRKAWVAAVARRQSASPEMIRREEGRRNPFKRPMLEGLPWM